MSALDWFKSAPPVSRTLVAATLVESALYHSGTISATLIIFQRPLLFKLLPEVWRLATPFLLTGGDMHFIIDLYFMWTYSTGLELHSSRFVQPGDFFTYLIFVCSVIVATSGFLLAGTVFTQALILALAYTYAQDNRGKRVTFIIFPIPIQYLPWVMLGFASVTGGLRAGMQMGPGLIAAHLFDVLTRLYPTFQGGRNYIETPAWIRKAFGADERSYTARGYGSAYRPVPAASTSQGSTSGVSGSGGSWSWSSALSGSGSNGSSWGHRGPGRVLSS